MATVILSPIVPKKLNKLIRILVKKGFFGFLDTAEEYVHGIYDFIENIPFEKKRPTKNPKHGTWFCRYSANKRTSWFITFDVENDTFLIRNIFNNHTRDYPTFIQGFK